MVPLLGMEDNFAYVQPILIYGPWDCVNIPFVSE